MKKPTIESLPDILRTATYDQAENLYKLGHIESDDFDCYCYVWRNMTFRYSTIGSFRARRYAQANYLPLAQSDFYPDVP